MGSATGRFPFRRRGWALGLFLLIGSSALAAWKFNAGAPAVPYRGEIVAEFPHDGNAYCQGLVYTDGVLLEGTGKYGESNVRRVRLETGEVIQQRDLDNKYFGEGIAVFDNKVYQITWREHVAFVYDKETLQPTGETFHYQGEGWGLTTDGQSLIMSDGTSVLRFLDPKTFAVKRRVAVQDGRRRVAMLNELEYIEGEIYANVWRENHLVRINPRSGAVTGVIDLSGLKSKAVWTGDEVLNGIAYDAEKKRLFVTGKNWTRLYEIRVVRNK